MKTMHPQISTARAGPGAELDSNLRSNYDSDRIVSWERRGFTTFNPNTHRATQGGQPQGGLAYEGDSSKVNCNLNKSPVLITIPNKQKPEKTDKNQISSDYSNTQGISIPKLDMQKINEFKGQMLRAQAA